MVTELGQLIVAETGAAGFEVTAGFGAAFGVVLVIEFAVELAACCCEEVAQIKT